MGSQAKFWGFDLVIAHFTQYAQQNDLPERAFGDKSKKKHLLTQLKGTDSNETSFKVIYWALDLVLLITLIWLS